MTLDIIPLHDTQQKQAQIFPSKNHLHTCRNKTLAIHRNSYFIPDIKEWLQLATGSLTKTYLLNYKPANYISIKHATDVSSSASILSFACFNHIIPPPATQTPVLTTNVNNNKPPHHKRVHKSDRFQFFSNNPPYRNLPSSFEGLTAFTWIAVGVTVHPPCAAVTGPNKIDFYIAS